MIRSGSFSRDNPGTHRKSCPEDLSVGKIPFGAESRSECRETTGFAAKNLENVRKRVLNGLTVRRFGDKLLTFTEIHQAKA